MVVASIDLQNGKAVQLRQGKERVLERDNPIELVKEFHRYGEVAVIDLDAAMGETHNNELIRELLKVAPCRVGGGIRSVSQAKELISFGASKVIIGSKAFEDDKINTGFLEELVQAISRDRIIIAVDVLHGEIVTRGWKHKTGIRLIDAAKALEEYAGGFLCTCVEREGMMDGIDLAQLKELSEATNVKITAAGGVSTLDEIEELAKLNMDVQLGMALYTGKINLADAFVSSLNWKSDLLPVITQDSHGQVLMQAFANREAVRKTLAEGMMCYYSRSRDSLWVKGETSGHFQQLRTLRTDCDRDSLLAVVDQKDVACHTGSYSCFGERNFSWTELYDVIGERLEKPTPGSYTAKLLEGDLLAEKLLEEAQEVIDAEEHDHIVWEAADVLYFLTVLMASKKVTISEVLHELRRRRFK